MMTIHLLCFESKELGDVEPEPDGETKKDVQQKVSPPLWQGQGDHHEHPGIAKNMFVFAANPKLLEEQ